MLNQSDGKKVREPEAGRGRGGGRHAKINKRLISLIICNMKKKKNQPFKFASSLLEFRGLCRSMKQGLNFTTSELGKINSVEVP